MPSASAKQPQLFRIENPLSIRLGKEFFRALPSVPGVYFFYSQEDELLYIGQSLDLRARIGSYRHVTPEKNAKRTLRLVHRVFRIEWKACDTSEEAIELERMLLLEYRPKFNRAGVWEGAPWWLKIDVDAGKLILSLSREAGGSGPHPSAFRHVFGSLARCLYRLSWPSASLSSYPHRFFDAAVPLNLSIALPESSELVTPLQSYVTGNAEQLLTQLEAMPLGITEHEMEYWQEERERLRKYAAKVRKLMLK
ncbi:MAG: nucleotide excision repair endonuclease [Verrucomicrobiota bacterium]